MPTDIYPMPSFPTLTVSNLAASTQWYRDALKFQVIFELPGRLLHLRRERYQDLLLAPGAADFFEAAKGEVGRGVSLYFALPGLAEVDALAAHAKAAGTVALEGPVNRHKAAPKSPALVRLKAAGFGTMSSVILTATGWRSALALSSVGRSRRSSRR